MRTDKEKTVLRKNPSGALCPNLELSHIQISSFQKSWKREALPDPGVVGKQERRLLGMGGVLAVSDNFTKGDIS